MPKGERVSDIHHGSGAPGDGVVVEYTEKTDWRKERIRKTPIG